MKSIRIPALLLILTVNFSFLVAQDSSPVLTIGDESFQLGEFWHVYNKNRHLAGFEETPEQFADRFINYKLKVVEAKAKGLDTLASFKDEYSKYAGELKSAFLVDSAALKESAREAYSNMQELVNASHLLITLAEGALPQDTLKAYNTIAELRSRALAGEDFNLLAENYSQDPSVVQNRGSLGYFSAFRMIYPFEKAAFATQAGSVSPIIRTDFGYHIIKVHERIPNKGKIRVAHIMKMYEANRPDSELRAKEAIDSIYQVLKEGESFEKLAAKFSDDKNSSDRRGEMYPFTMAEMYPDFALAAFNLESDGEVSEPVRTAYGWHIIKRIELTPVGSFEDELPYITNMLSRHGRVESVSDKEAQNLALDNPAYRYLVNEYYDGLLIFEISDREIWQNVGKDTLALQEYYRENIREFTPAPLMTGTVCEIFDDRLFRKVSKIVANSEGSYNLVQILKENARKPEQFKLDEGEFAFVLNAPNPVEVAVLPASSVLKQYKGALFWQGEVRESEPLPYSESLGQVMSSYQQYKEQEWVEALREKYQPRFNYDLIKRKR